MITTILSNNNVCQGVPRDLTVNEDGFITYGSFSRPEQKTIRRLLVYEGALDDINCNNRNNLSGNEGFTF